MIIMLFTTEKGRINVHCVVKQMLSLTAKPQMQLTSSGTGGFHQTPPGGGRVNPSQRERGCIKRERGCIRPRGRSHVSDIWRGKGCPLHPYFRDCWATVIGPKWPKSLTFIITKKAWVQTKHLPRPWVSCL